jgi:hypothetical protein
MFRKIIDLKKKMKNRNSLQMKINKEKNKSIIKTIPISADFKKSNDQLKNKRRKSKNRIMEENYFLLLQDKDL